MVLYIKTVVGTIQAMYRLCTITLKVHTRVLRAVCMPVQVQRLKESRLTIRGDGDQDFVVSEEV